MKRNHDKTFLVTGASSGIGNSTANHLAREGYTVLATIRKEADAEKLNRHNIDNLIPVYPLDFTHQEEINEAGKLIGTMVSKREIPPLYALIFIAGGGHIAPIELMDIGKFREELEKRLVGTVTLLQKLLPYLRQSRGRIVWISTPGLFPVPYVADIHAPDFAVNYLARTLNIELKPDGIKNILIRCGGINTPAPRRTEQNIAQSITGFEEERIDIYRDRLNQLEEQLKQFSTKRTEPLCVAKLIERVLEKENPKTKYQIGYMSKMGSLLENLPQKWVDSIMYKRG